MYRDIINMTDIDLEKLRKLSKSCSDNKKTQEYVRDVCFKLRDLLKNYARDIKAVENTILEKYLGHTAAPKSFNTGQIPTKYINEVINKGNIRERLTLIMNFCMSGCYVILWAVENKKHFTKESISILQKRLYNLTGIQSIAKFNKYIKKCENSRCILPCKFVSLAADGSVAASRMTAFPIVDILREPRAKKISKYLVNIKDAYPKVSSRELEYIREDSNYIIKNNILPWISGLQYWEINEKNFYVRLMRQHKQMVVCGPSGNTDLDLSLFRLFDNFDINLAIFACISHLCNTPDHSPCEILLAALPYGLDDWTIEEDSFKYVNKKLRLYK